MLRILLCCALVLTGCASNSRFNLDIPLSQASSMATQSSVSARSIRSSPSSGFYSRATVSGRASFFTPFDPYWYGSYDHRFLIGRQTALNIGVTNYDLLTGYNLAYAARMDDQEFHFSIFFTEIDFQANDTTAGLTEPLLFGLNIDWHKLFPYGQMAFVIGGRLTFAQLAFGYENSLIIDGTVVDSDAISVFGLGIPMGVQWDVEPFTFEILATPTFYVHEQSTFIGFMNDVVSMNVSTPVSLGIGFTF